MTARVGAVHLGWDVVSVAAGGGGAPIRPVQVEGTYTPPAYLLADSSGRLHTAGVDRRPDVGIAISDVRDILGHPQIVVAGATWPADLVFRARLHNPLAAVAKHLGGQPDVLALPFPDEWPDPQVDEYVRLVEQLGVVAEALPESVALSGYIRALGLVRGPGRGPAVGATGVYSDGRECLVVAVHGDDEQPTESVSVPITEAALHEARAADNVVIEVMAAARAIDADTSTILLSGNVCFNDALRLAFQNHLGHRFQVADHPMHALVLGATHLLVADSEAEGFAEPAARQPDSSGTGGQQAVRAPEHGPAGQPAPSGPRHAEHGPARPAQPATGEFAPPRHSHSTPVGASAHPVPQGQPAATPPMGQTGQTPPMGQAGQQPVGQAGQQQPVGQSGQQPVVGQAGQQAAGQPGQQPAGQSGAEAGGAARPLDQGPRNVAQPPADPAGVEQTRRMTPEEVAQAPVASRGGLPPGLAGVGGRFTRPPGTPADDQMTAVMGRGPQSQQGDQQGSQQAGGTYGQPGAQSSYGQGQPGYQGGQPGGYGQGGYGAPGTYPGPSGNAPGQGGSMYGGSMPSSGSRPSHPGSPEDVAGQPDSESGAEGERKPRKGKLWGKMKDKFGAPIVIGATALTAIGLQTADAPSAGATAEPCALAPSITNIPRQGISAIDEQQDAECLRLGIGTLRYTIPGPARGIDPGPPVQI
ncbi:hypothetical protein [Nocardia sp. NPDC127526]|uniref:hypothetical protein n=1 Tax=Nocardia sp. NPDC127526 TaxID=3345393 RepID=UPI00363EDC41